MPQEQLSTSEVAVILPFRQRGSEYIAGELMHLGLMSDVELDVLEAQTLKRKQDAIHEWSVVLDYINSERESEL